MCGIEHNVLIAAEIDWKPLGDCSTVLEQVIDMSTDFQVSLDVEMTLTKRFLPIFPHISSERVNEANLIDAAFQPKIYKLELAKGRFAMPDWLHWEGKTFSPPRDDPEIWFGLRLVFDKSPYPPLEEWIEESNYGGPWRSAKANKYFEFRDFYQDTEESVYRRPDEKTMAERRQKVLERSRRMKRLHEEEEEASRSS